MSLRNAITSNKQSGTFSSGALQTTSEKQWWKEIEDNIVTKIEFLPLAVSKTTGIESPSEWCLIFPKINFTTANVIPDLSQKRITQYWQSEKLPAIRENISKQFSAVRQRLDNWDNQSSKKPNRLSISSAEGILEDLLNSVIDSGYLWLTPFISSDEDGDIAIEWQKGQHELHIEISEDEAEYIKVWGTNIESEMHLDFLNRNSYNTLWEWLLHG